MEIKDVKLVDFTPEVKKFLKEFMVRGNEPFYCANLNTKEQLRSYLNKIVSR